MKTITITLTVPDDVDVQLAGAAPTKPFVERPDPPAPDEPCPVHGTGWRMIKGGLSRKTGKRFNSFWVCQTEGCDERPGRHEETIDYLS
jgi:hypothetical protein